MNISCTISPNFNARLQFANTMPPRKKSVVRELARPCIQVTGTIFVAAKSALNFLVMCKPIIKKLFKIKQSIKLPN